MAIARTDPLGNAIRIEMPSTATVVDDFVQGFICCDLRVRNILQAQNDGSTMVQAYLAMFNLFAESPQGLIHAQSFLAQAQRNCDQGDARTCLFVQAISAWEQGRLRHAIALHEQIAQRFPRDLVSLKLGQYHAFNLGDAPAMLRLALRAQATAEDVPQFHGMAAFAYEQCHLLDDAERHARQAITMHRAEPWAHHALAHVMLTRGEFSAGTAFMEEMSTTWQGLNSFMQTHNWWHLALFYIEQDRLDDALALHDHEVWGVDKNYTQDQINAVSLLARLELAGQDVGQRWQDVADHLEARIADQTLPFLDMQYLYGLARAGRSSAEELLRHVERKGQPQKSQSPQDTLQAVWQDVALPACQGLLAHAQGHYEQAVRHLGTALPRLQEIGGSHAQRDLFEQIHLDALQKSGHLSAAQNILQQRLNSQPQSLRLRRQARKVYASLGLPGLKVVERNRRTCFKISGG